MSGQQANEVVGICHECGRLTPHDCPPPPVDDWRTGMFSGTWSARDVTLTQPADTTSRSDQ